MEELRLNQLFIQRMVIQSMVHDQLEMGCMNVMKSFILLKQNQEKNTHSFFITQSQINQENHLGSYSISEVAFDEWNRSNEVQIPSNSNTSNIIVNDLLTSKISQEAIPDLSSNDHLMKHSPSSPLSSQLQVEDSSSSQYNSKPRVHQRRPLRRQSKVMIYRMNYYYKSIL